MNKRYISNTKPPDISFTNVFFSYLYSFQINHQCPYSSQLSQGLLPTLHPRTPKLLAPLDGRPRDVAALPALKHHVPLKPISRSPLCSRTRLRREGLSWGSPRTGPLSTKGGSEESGSSSSSHSSIDLEDEEEEDERTSGGSHLKFVKLLQHSNNVSCTETDSVGETRQDFNVRTRISHIPEPINHAGNRFGTEKADRKSVV